MTIGYIIGGLLVFGFMPAMIYALTSLLDNVYKLEIIDNLTIRWTIIM